MAGVSAADSADARAASEAAAVASLDNSSVLLLLAKDSSGHWSVGWALVGQNSCWSCRRKKSLTFGGA